MHQPLDLHPLFLMNHHQIVYAHMDHLQIFNPLVTLQVDGEPFPALGRLYPHQG